MHYCGLSTQSLELGLLNVQSPTAQASSKRLHTHAVSSFKGKFSGEEFLAENHFRGQHSWGSNQGACSRSLEPRQNVLLHCLASLVGLTDGKEMKCYLLNAALHCSWHGCSKGVQSSCVSLLFFAISKQRFPWLELGLSVCWLLWLQHDKVSPRQLFTESCYLNRSFSDMLTSHFCKYLLIVMSKSLWGLCELPLQERCWTACSWPCRFLPPRGGLSSACSTVGRRQTGAALFLGLAPTRCIMW